ncbi:MAG: dihydrodipicolinate synthase family protein [Candidatus Parvarchaeota archaeon]
MPDMIVPLVTPFDNGIVSTPKLRNHADYILKKGANYVFLCGSTGLGPSLNLNERLSILHAFEDIPEKVILQVGSLNLDETLALARAAAKLQIHAIALLPPYYYPRIPEEWLLKYFKTVSEIYPTIIYNFPLATGYDLASAFVEKVLATSANIIGIKDTVSDITHMLQIKWNTDPSFKVYCGPDSLGLSALRSGLDGIVGGSGNYVPVILRALVDHFNDETGIKAQKLIEAITSIARKYGQWSANYALVKIIQSYDSGGPRPPIFPLDNRLFNNLKTDVRTILPDGDMI